VTAVADAVVPRPRRRPWAEIDQQDGTSARQRSYEALVRAKAGDRDAFGELYLMHRTYVYRFVSSRVGNRQLAEDITQETFLRGFHRLESFTWLGRDIGAWFITIARNQIADHYKSGRVRSEGPSLDADGGLHIDTRDTSAEGNPEQTVIDHLRNVALIGALQLLTDEQRQCIVLRYLNQLSVAEVAEAMGKDVGAIKAMQYRATQALHRHITAAGLTR
jgi:RNA polymerase sigma-70 factor (ECF subfamily)